LRPQPGLPADLFAKFSRDFSSSFRDRRRQELLSEIRLCELARLPAFPIRVPLPQFADFESSSGTGLLISEQVPFGSRGVEPLHPKCMDHELQDPLQYYRCILGALARLAAAHKAGRLSPQVDRYFPFDAETEASADVIPYTEQDLRQRVWRYGSFARLCPQLMPAHLTTGEFLERFERDAMIVYRRQQEIRRYLHSDPDYIALSHFNSNIDNAWFWRDASGELHCGLFDWQRARQLNLGYALWGGLCGAGFDIWRHQLTSLLQNFARDVHALGGPALEPTLLRSHLELYAATIGLAGLMETPELVLKHVPAAARTVGPLDPLILSSEAARSFLHIFTNFLNVFYRADFRGLIRSI
jgi:hypothetical protein